VGYSPRISTAVWVGHPLSRDLTGYGGQVAGPIWQSYMSAAHGSYCSDFPQPASPFEPSSSWSGAHSVSSPSSSSGGTSGASGSYVPPTSTTGKYPSQYYSPGAGAEPSPTPSPTPSPDTGGGDGGGPPSGTPAPPGGGPPSTGGGSGGGSGGTG